MPGQRAFGRRPAARPAGEQPAKRPASVPFPVEHAPHQTQAASPPAQDSDPKEHQPRRRFPIPWRQIWLMASLCFGIGSLVLPDSVNDDVQWLLYALMAASLYTGLRRGAKS